jgi:hypothetical protein
MRASCLKGSCGGPGQLRSRPRIRDGSTSTMWSRPWPLDSCRSAKIRYDGSCVTFFYRPSGSDPWIPLPVLTIAESRSAT